MIERPTEWGELQTGGVLEIARGARPAFTQRKGAFNWKRRRANRASLRRAAAHLKDALCDKTSGGVEGTPTPTGSCQWPDAPRAPIFRGEGEWEGG